MTTALAATAGGAAALAGLRWAVWRGFRAPRMAGSHSPADLGLACHDIRIPTANCKTLAGWLIPAAPEAPVVVAMHGWGANGATLLPLAAALHRRGFALVLADARNHGRSDADNFSSMPRFAEDIEAVLDWLAPCPVPVAVLGHSVGGAAAILAASRRADIAAVISLSAFDHPERVMRASLARARIPFMPFGWAICRYVERVIGHRFDAIAPLAAVAAIRCPALIGHGADDVMVPPDCARAIVAASGGRAELALLDGAGHETVPCYDELAELLAAFLRRALAA